MLDLRADSREAEIRELEAVAEALARTPRLAALLRYMGEKYFNGAAEELTEYNIATEVCGRSRSAFVAGEDAIARVEVHRLRKRLREYYAKEGQNHIVHISIPAGRYVPTFTRTAAADSAVESSATPPIEGITVADPEPRTDLVDVAEPVAIPLTGRRVRWVYLWVILALLIAGIAIPGLLRLRRSHNGNQRPGFSTADHEAVPMAAAGDGSVRIIAGYTGEPIRDISGNLWSSDRYFHGGTTWPNSASVIERTSDPLLFRSWRSGDFTYDIPLKPGVYELHLYFVLEAGSDADADRAATFDVSANGRKLLTAFDVNSDALGNNVADERVFRDISPGADGFVHLSFAHDLGVPSLSALEIVPGLHHRQLPIRIAAERTAFIDHDGNTWTPDNYYENGVLSSLHQAVTGTPDPQILGSERFGHFTYALPVDTRDQYTLVLHFAELYFGPGAPGGGGVGSRVFNVFCNGKTLLENFDIYKEAGTLHVLTKTFQHLKPSPQGKLNLTFEPVANNATISGIEVLDESR